MLAFSVGIWKGLVEFDLSLAPLGWLNACLLNFIVFWYASDAFFARREIYEIFGVYEGRLHLQVRQLRMLAFVMLCLLAIWSAVDTRLDELIKLNPETETDVELNRTRSLILISGVALGTIGWIFTNFQKLKADRAISTLMAIRDQMYDEFSYKDYLRLKHICKKIRERDAMTEGDVFPLEVFNTKLSEFSGRRTKDNVTLAMLVDRLLNMLNQLALGVRQGQFDYRTIELVLRPRFILHGYNFSEYIADELKAKKPEPKGILEAHFMRNLMERKMSCRRTWEHFLWMCWRLPILESDTAFANQNAMVMPPKLQAGQRTWTLSSRDKVRGEDEGRHEDDDDVKDVIPPSIHPMVGLN